MINIKSGKGLKDYLIWSDADIKWISKMTSLVHIVSNQKDIFIAILANKMILGWQWLLGNHILKTWPQFYKFYCEIKKL